MNRAARLAWLVIGWNVATIVLGALVRATHSGAGCGPSWPACQGEILPELVGATSVEYTHRVASGVALVLVAVLAPSVWRSQPRGHPARRAVDWAAGSALGEALIGAVIVLYEWVEDDASLARVISVPFHLINTLLLLASLTLTAWFLSGGGSLTGRRGRRGLTVGALALVLIFATGAVTALADTLFPVAGLSNLETAHFLTRLRILHPILAVTAVVGAVVAVRRQGFPLKLVRRVLWLSIAQLGLGALNIFLVTPLWMQLLHLVVADTIWIAFVWLAAQVLASDSARAEASSTGARQRNPLHK